MDQISQSSRRAYFELSRHTTLQFIVFGLLTVLCVLALFLYIALPLMTMFFSGFLRAEVVATGKVMYAFQHDAKPEEVQVSPYLNWAIVEEQPENGKGKIAKYLFNPILSFAPILATFAFALAALLSALLPQNIGLLRQKIYREIINSLDKIAVILYGEHTDRELEEIIDNILTADIRKLHDYSNSIGISYTEIESLRAALEWQQSTGLTTLWKVHGAFKFYMRTYFTVKYSNTILGSVYIGAAALIIIIGIRGLKFIPPTEPSIILSALGLEFILLITYAIMLMYSKQEEELSAPGNIGVGDSPFPNMGKGAEEVENLLRVFIAKQRKTK